MNDDERDEPGAEPGDLWGIPEERELLPPVEDWSGLGEDLLASEPAEPAEPAGPTEAAEPASAAAAVTPGAHEPVSELLAGEAVGSVQMPEGGTAFQVTFSAKQIQRVRDLLTRLYAMRRAAKFYPPQHPASVDAVRGLYEVIVRYHGEGVDVPLAFFEGEIFLGERFLPEDSVLFDQLIRDMGAIGAGSITFARGLTLDELKRALPVLGADFNEAKAAGGVEAMAISAGIPHVIIGAVTVIDAARGPIEQVDDKEMAKEAYGGAIELLRELERVIRSNQAISSGQVKGVVRSLVDNVLTNRYAMLELTGLKNYDEYTFFHSVNVAILSLALGSQVTSDYRFLSSLGVGALMHDIGKLSIDVDILNKPGSLTSEEWALVRLHPVYGAETAAGMPGLDKSSVVVILEHHMRYDLTGYPQRVPPKRQHLASRIVAVSDAYDAMTSRRSYSAARLQDEGMSLLAKNAGSAFDPTLVRLFITLLGVYPPRSVVRLSSGETAIVVGPSVTDVLRPHVRVIADGSGSMIDPFDMDLSDLRVSEGRSIVQCLDAEGMNVSVEDFI